MRLLFRVRLLLRRDGDTAIIGSFSLARMPGEGKARVAGSRTLFLVGDPGWLGLSCSQLSTSEVLLRRCEFGYSVRRRSR